MVKRKSCVSLKYCSTISLSDILVNKNKRKVQQKSGKHKVKKDCWNQTLTLIFPVVDAVFFSICCDILQFKLTD